ncbi:endonuclease [Mycoplasma tauri]|uniref:endonuclease n=1 Tax=Mycoplasma tauri TaxID=547987 RepID=UPI001CBB94F5|nr:endonuclease [Mycoplasma tauri]MBZ4203445.1 endonuclease [Mycoplasma tauri]
MKKINILTTISLLSTTSLIVLSSQCKASDTKEKQQKVDDETNNVSNQKDKITLKPSVEEKLSDNDKSQSDVKDTTNKEITNDKIKLPKGAYYSTQGEDNKYYQALDGLNGIELYRKLHDIQNKKAENVNNYDYLYHSIYKDAFKDQYYEKDNSVLDIYSENPKGSDPYNFNFNNYHGRNGKPIMGRTEGQEGYRFNREHIIPKSYFEGYEPMHNDAHHVWPTDQIVNEKRGNSPHFIVDNPNITSLNGTKIISEKRRNKRNREYDFAIYTEPIDEFKGDIARVYFYFAITYVGENNWLKGPGKEVFSWNSGKVLKNKYFDVYKQWSVKDKIDAFDIVRNNEIAKHQVVRNPFSDYPELIDLILNPQGRVFKNKGVLKIDLDKYFKQ